MRQSSRRCIVTLAYGLRQPAKGRRKKEAKITAKKKGKVNSQRAKRLRKMIEGEKKAGNWAHVEKLERDLKWEPRIIRSRRAAQKEEAEREAKVRAARYASPKIYEGGATGLRQQKRK